MPILRDTESTDKESSLRRVWQALVLLFPGIRSQEYQGS